jgi:RimJ/RimL family protein N-acetyltransferase
MEIDFVQHVALVACVDDAGRSSIVGGGRYVVAKPGSAEMAFMVIDAWQGRGIGTMTELVAEVLRENIAMRRVFERLGFVAGARSDPDTIHLVLDLTGLPQDGAALR